MPLLVTVLSCISFRYTRAHISSCAFGGMLFSALTCDAFLVVLPHPILHSSSLPVLPFRLLHCCSCLIFLLQAAVDCRFSVKSGPSRSTFAYASHVSLVSTQTVHDGNFAQVSQVLALHFLGCADREAGWMTNVMDGVLVPLPLCSLSAADPSLPNHLLVRIGAWPGWRRFIHRMRACVYVRAHVATLVPSR